MSSIDDILYSPITEKPSPAPSKDSAWVSHGVDADPEWIVVGTFQPSPWRIAGAHADNEVLDRINNTPVSSEGTVSWMPVVVTGGTVSE
jgi:hypothetical protein